MEPNFATISIKYITFVSIETYLEQFLVKNETFSEHCV